MISSVRDIHSSGDAIEFVEDNMEALQKIESEIEFLFGALINRDPYEYLADFLENDLPNERKKMMHWAEERFRERLINNTVMLCATESYAYDLDGMPYHKLWGGCGWSGPAFECIIEEYEHRAFRSLMCPKCGYEVWDRAGHEEDMRRLRAGEIRPLEVYEPQYISPDPKN